MGCSSDRSVITIDDKKMNAFEPFKSLIETRIKLDNCNQEEDFYIIQVKSIPKFIEIIEKPECKNYINDKKNNKNTDKDLTELFNDYQKENIIILSNFVDCFRLFEQNIENENKFIFVEESFFKNMGIDILKKKIREIHVDKNHKYIIFNNTDKRIGFKEIDNILYKFVESEDTISLMNDTSRKEERNDINFNPKGELIIKIKNNENKNKEQIYYTKKGDNNNEISNNNGNENKNKISNNIGNENKNKISNNIGNENKNEISNNNGNEKKNEISNNIGNENKNKISNNIGYENKNKISNNNENENNNEISNNENNKGNENKDIKSNIKDSVNTNNILVKEGIIDLDGAINGYMNESY